LQSRPSISERNAGQNGSAMLPQSLPSLCGAPYKNRELPGEEAQKIADFLPGKARVV
jgi:hypothetical protein